MVPKKCNLLLNHGFWMFLGGVQYLEERVIKVRIKKSSVGWIPMEDRGSHILLISTCSFGAKASTWWIRWIQVKCMMRMKYVGIFWICLSTKSPGRWWYIWYMIFHWNGLLLALSDFFPATMSPQGLWHLPTDQDLRNFHHGSGQMWTCVGHPQRQAQSTRQVHGSQMMAILMWKMNEHEIHWNIKYEIHPEIKSRFLHEWTWWESIGRYEIHPEFQDQDWKNQKKDPLHPGSGDLHTLKCHGEWRFQPGTFQAKKRMERRVSNSGVRENQLLSNWGIHLQTRYI